MQEGAGDSRRRAEALRAGAAESARVTREWNEKMARKQAQREAKQADHRAKIEEQEAESAAMKARKEAKKQAQQQQLQEESAENEAKKLAKDRARIEEQEAEEAEEAERRASKEARKEAKQQAKEQAWPQDFQAILAKREAKDKAKREKQESRRQQLLKDAPITGLMLRKFVSPTRPAYHDIIIDNLLQSIGERIVAQTLPVLADSAAKSKPRREPILRGRTPDLYRIDFAPAATGVTSISGRLRSSLQKPNWKADVEELMSLFVAWNKSAYPDITPGQMVVRVRPKENEEERYRSCWLHHQTTYNVITPVTWYKRKETVAAVVQSVRERCQKMNPGSLLLCDGASSTAAPEAKNMYAREMEKVNQREWSLMKDTEGFGAQVMSCFYGKEVTWAEYEDRIERCLYAFRSANKDAVYGLLDNGEV